MVALVVRGSGSTGGTRIGAAAAGELAAVLRWCSERAGQAPRWGGSAARWPLQDVFGKGLLRGEKGVAEAAAG